jgi:hypothetical protein
MVVMEHLSFQEGTGGWVKLGAFKGKLDDMADPVRNELEAIIRHLQAQQMVHADMRPKNIMTKVDRQHRIVIMAIMYSTAHTKIRKQCFEAFWYTHHLYTHATGCFVRGTALPSFTSTFPFYDPNLCIGYLSWHYMTWPGIIYFFERVWREVRARCSTKLSKVLVHPSTAASSRRRSSTPPASGRSFTFPMFSTSSGIR